MTETDYQPRHELHATGAIRNLGMEIKLATELEFRTYYRQTHPRASTIEIKYKMLPFPGRHRPRRRSRSTVTLASL